MVLYTTTKSLLTPEKLNLTLKLLFNKHSEILVSCSDKERNCIQIHETAFLDTLLLTDIQKTLGLIELGLR